jgi:hypothetical protein
MTSRARPQPRRRSLTGFEFARRLNASLAARRLHTGPEHHEHAISVLSVRPDEMTPNKPSALDAENLSRS